MRDNSWIGIVAQCLMVFALFIAVAALNSCINEDKRTDCEKQGGQYIQNRDSDLSSCVMPRRWN